MAAAVAEGQAVHVPPGFLHGTLVGDGRGGEGRGSGLERGKWSGVHR